MPNTLKRLIPDPDVIKLQQLLSSNGYFEEIKPAHGLFDGNLRGQNNLIKATKAVFQVSVSTCFQSTTNLSAIKSH